MKEEVPEKFRRKKSSFENNPKSKQESNSLSDVYTKIPRRLRINNNTSNNTLIRGFFGSSTNENCPDL